MKETVEALLAYCRANDRVCLLPQKWNQLWEMLPDRRRVGANWEPALPLILATWNETPAILKMVRLSEHIGWVEKHGGLDEVGVFLRTLDESEWHHIGD